MRVSIVAVGRLKSGPELTLINDYADRFRKTGRGLGFTALEIIEVDERKATTKQAQGSALLSAHSASGMIWACDERGKQLSSMEFAKALQALADQGISDLTFMIGGADGLSSAVLDRADRKLSFGPMVWPHILVRVMMTEQLYRAASILAGLPYHRA
ncbi:MAG: 23S rRNA (pseudouridine(1915)-N(3))-methyltransferase RlmH [Pseudomonadota bacterium]